jgi:hypothetical protein
VPHRNRQSLPAMPCPGCVCHRPISGARATQGALQADHSLTSTTTVLILWEDPGLWEDLVHYRAPKAPGSPDPPRSPDPGRTTTRSAPTRHYSHRHPPPPPRASPPAHCRYPRPVPDYSPTRPAAQHSLDNQPTDQPGPGRSAILPSGGAGCHKPNSLARPMEVRGPPAPVDTSRRLVKIQPACRMATRECGAGLPQASSTARKPPCSKPGICARARNRRGTSARIQLYGG